MIQTNEPRETFTRNILFKVNWHIGGFWVLKKIWKRIYDKKKWNERKQKNENNNGFLSLCAFSSSKNSIGGKIYFRMASTLEGSESLLWLKVKDVFNTEMNVFTSAQINQKWIDLYWFRFALGSNWWSTTYTHICTHKSIFSSKLLDCAFCIVELAKYVNKFWQ